MIVGIDPGKSGAIAIIDDFRAHIVDVIDLDGQHSTMLRAIPSNTTIFIERVASSPRMGVSSAFSFGETFGLLQGIALSKQCAVRYAMPRKWKSFFNLSSDKDASREKARQLFPEQAHLFKRKKDADRAEAVLIAYWGSLQ